MDDAAEAQEERRQAHADHRQDHHRQGSPNRAGTAKAHGEALGPDEIKLTREALGWAHEPFVIPAEVYAGDAKASGAKLEAAWDERFAAYRRPPELAAEFTRRMAGEGARQLCAGRCGRRRQGQHRRLQTVAQPQASQLALESFTAAVPELLGGSADLTGSNLTNTSHTPNRVSMPQAPATAAT